MLRTLTGFTDGALTFLLSAGGVFFVGMLFLAALAGLFRARRPGVKILCGAVLALCLLYGLLLIWLSIGFGSGGRTPVPLQP